jgi:hypothetical protein
VAGRLALRVALPGILAAVALVGCGSTQHGTAGGTKTPTQTIPKAPVNRDIEWLARLRAWKLRMGDAFMRLESRKTRLARGEGSRADLLGAMPPLAKCTASLTHEVGTPKTQPYPPIYALLKTACKDIERTATATAALFGPRARQAKRMLKRSSIRLDTFFEGVDGEIKRTMLSNRVLPTKGGLTSKSRFEPRLSRVADAPTGAGILVRCWSPREWRRVKREYVAYFGGTTHFLGFTQEDISLAPSQCAILARVVYRHFRPRGGRQLMLTAGAVGVLAHESAHAFDSWTNEAQTECRGMQLIRKLGLLLGASRAYAGLLATTYWREIYPLDDPDYRTPACHSGSALDRTPNDGVWP